MKKSKKRLKRGVESKPEAKPESRNSGDALQGYGTIENWEKHHGHGFWGNSTTGYITDEEERRMR
ncbi:MAG: hypothetical protein WC333_00330 [Dehalococcoidia bacterium]|jgi:hypothetical protein